MKSDEITVMIVDDDIKSQELLAHHLRTIPGVAIVAVASGAAEAYKIILEHFPDIVFLDVEMPVKTGFDLVYDLHKRNIHPCIIFQTAYDKYAVEAIKSAAFDYLLKPIDPEELHEALARFRTSGPRALSTERVEGLIRKSRSTGKIKLKSKNGFVLVDPVDIYYCQSDWNYTDIFYGENKKTTLSMTLRKVQAILPEGTFFRISRSVLINLWCLAEVSRQDRTCILNIAGKQVSFPINRKHIAELEEKVG